MLILGKWVSDLEKPSDDEISQIIDNSDKQISPKEFIKVVDR